MAPSAPADTPVLVAMVKAPRVGLVKTRLGAQIGAASATQVYRLMVEQQIAAVPHDWRVEIHFSPPDAGAELLSWLGPAPSFIPQCEGDLGMRLTHAVAGAFQRKAAAVIVVGGDCPTLDEPGLRRTQEALRGSDVVLGPALDGGYYLIGLHQPHPHLFAAIPWSTNRVLQTTLLRTAELGLRYSLLEPREDVDERSGLQRFIDETSPATEELRATLRALVPAP